MGLQPAEQVVVEAVKDAQADRTDREEGAEVAQETVCATQVTPFPPFLHQTNAPGQVLRDRMALGVLLPSSYTQVQCFVLIIGFCSVWSLWDRPWLWNTLHCWYNYPFHPLGELVRAKQPASTFCMLMLVFLC